MQNFNSERIGMAASCTGYARVCLDEAIAYAKERKRSANRSPSTR
jgi:acyl-CoA dehydrogenase